MAQIYAFLFSDRIILSDFYQWEELAQKHFGGIGQDFDKYPKWQIEAFLRDFMKNETLELLEIISDKDVNHGNPIWAFRVKFEENA